MRFTHKAFLLLGHLLNMLTRSSTVDHSLLYVSTIYSICCLDFYFARWRGARDRFFGDLKLPQTRTQFDVMNPLCVHPCKH